MNSRRIANVVGLSCLLISTAAQAEVRVVTTVPDLAALAKEIGGTEAKIVALSLATQDPHFVDARPSLVLDINKADLLVVVGLDLEIGWLPTLLIGGRNPNVQRGGPGYLDCSQFAQLQEKPTRPIDRSMGDLHPGGNPHYLHDPREALRCAIAIHDKLVTIAPKAKATFDANLQRFSTAIKAAIPSWESSLASHKGSKVISFHRSWIYLLNWLSLSLADCIEPKPGIAPSPSHVLRLLQLGKAQNVRAIVQENYYPASTGTLIAQKLKVPFLSLPSATKFEKGQSYIQHIDELVLALQKGLRK